MDVLILFILYTTQITDAPFHFNSMINLSLRDSKRALVRLFRLIFRNFHFSVNVMNNFSTLRILSDQGFRLIVHIDFKCYSFRLILPIHGHYWNLDHTSNIKRKAILHTQALNTITNPNSNINSDHWGTKSLPRRAAQAP